MRWGLVDDDKIIWDKYPFNSRQWHMWARCMCPLLDFHDAKRYSHNLPVFLFHWETSWGRLADAPGRPSHARASNHQCTQTHIQHPSILLSPSHLPSPWTAPLCQNTQGHEEQGIMVEHLPTIRGRFSEFASVINSICSKQYYMRPINALCTQDEKTSMMRSYITCFSSHSCDISIQVVFFFLILFVTMSFYNCTIFAWKYQFL